MSTWLRTNIVGLLALFVALSLGLGATAYAAKAAKNSVTSKSIKNNVVKSVDVKNNALTGQDIRESTLEGVNGLTVTHLSHSLPAGGAAFTVASEAGSSVKLTCGASTVTAQAIRIDGGPPVLYEVAEDGAPSSAYSVLPGFMTTVDSVGAHWQITILRAAGGWTKVDVTGIFETNVGLGTDDCWFRGTITRNP